MPITEKSFANFYLGASAELLVASELYARGYEALRMNPDAGIDFIVTNKARRRFRSEVPRDIEIQVKSAFTYRNEAFLSLKKDEFKYLTDSAERFLVVVIFSHFAKNIDPQSANYLGTSVDRSLEEHIVDYENAQVNREGWKMRSEDPDLHFEFEAKKKTVFWLNSAQLSRGLSDGHWRPKPKHDDYYQIKIRVEEASITINDLPILAELLHLPYMLEECSMSSALSRGNYTWAHI